MINQLDAALVNKIAAGEIIERPSNIIKELLENSFDAGADEIKIEIEKAGLRKIKVSDNGVGMSRDDLLVSYKRHTTSKISKEEDLYNINSFGFRGEALSSIAEISNLKIWSKRGEDRIGTFIEVESGKLHKESSTATVNGTIIEVSDIFFNVPARKKYLKSEDIEFSHILNIITRYALIKKDVLIRLYHNKKEILNSQKTQSLLNNIISIYGAEIGRNLINVNYTNETLKMKVEGYISKPSLTRSDKSDQSVYINNRYVKDSVITNSVYEAYKTLLFINRHPIFVLNLELDPSQVDVNVHPAKNIVKLENEELVSRIIFEAVKEAFKRSNLIPDITLDNEEPNQNKLYDLVKDKQAILGFNEPLSTLEINKNEEVIKTNSEPGNLSLNLFTSLNILGQVNKTYIIAIDNESLVIIDQHAAEERVNYEKFMKEIKTNAIKKQNMLTPKIIELNPNQFSTALNNKDLLLKIGFDFHELSNNTIKLETIPEIFGRLKSTIFIDIINELIKNKNNMMDKDIEERIIRFSCRESIKAGDELTLPQMKKLLESLRNTLNPYSCPHGRPTIIRLSNSELEKKFKRTGW